MIADPSDSVRKISESVMTFVNSVMLHSSTFVHLLLALPISPMGTVFGPMVRALTNDAFCSLTIFAEWVCTLLWLPLSAL